MKPSRTKKLKLHAKQAGKSNGQGDHIYIYIHIHLFKPLLQLQRSGMEFMKYARNRKHMLFAVSFCLFFFWLTRLVFNLNFECSCPFLFRTPFFSLHFPLPFLSFFLFFLPSASPLCSSHDSIAAFFPRTASPSQFNSRVRDTL